MILEKLQKIQKELKAPKGQFNNFGRFNYRSCEDILEAVKPLLTDLGVVLTLSDELVYLGDRYYIKANASLIDGEEKITISAYAREEETKKGMDGSQITGAASSYARKHALNGLFLIDDTKDQDTNEARLQAGNSPESYRVLVGEYCKQKKIDKRELATKFGISAKTTEAEYETIYKELTNEL